MKIVGLILAVAGLVASVIIALIMVARASYDSVDRQAQLRRASTQATTATDAWPEKHAQLADKRIKPTMLYQNTGAKVSTLIMRDELHDCDYVVIGNNTFVWRGTNLLNVVK